MDIKTKLYDMKTAALIGQCPKSRFSFFCDFIVRTFGTFELQDPWRLYKTRDGDYFLRIGFYGSSLFHLTNEEAKSFILWKLGEGMLKKEFGAEVQLKESGEIVRWIFLNLQ